MLSRREVLASAAAIAVSPAAACATAPTSSRPKDEPFKYGLNTSTLGWKQPIDVVVDLMAKSGYQVIEPWIRELEAYTKAGGSLRDLGKKLADAGISVESAIGFAPWIVDDDAKRAKGVEQMK